jgi:hypothetical protein
MPPPIYAPAHPWIPPRSRYIRLYHGCTSHDAMNILAHGIDLTLCRPDTDFGRGFYTTTVHYQARQWAWARFYDPAVARIRPNQPVVLKFLVDRRQLAALLFISFVLAGRSKRNFWSLVQHCKQSTAATINDHRGPVTLADGTRWYDVACGPVAAFWRQKFAMQDADQFSFHTYAGVCLLNQQIHSGNKKFFEVESLA